MHYYEVWVRSTAYRGNEALTYQYATDLPVGSIVRVPLQRASVPAVVVRKVSKPAFTTKSFSEVMAEAAVPGELLTLGKKIADFYATPIGAVTQLFVPNDVGSIEERSPATVRPTLAANLPPLTSEQQTAVERCTQPGAHLLHGKTGSGKTRVYIELARKALAAGKSTILLTPEISLTSQLVAHFSEVFGDAISVLHSGLTPKQRRETWAHIAASASPKIIIGARSALFSPLRNVDLIIVDEAHEPAYKQETAPYYHAVRVASMLALIHDARLVLGSATPSVVDYYIAEQKKSDIITMTSRATGGVTIDNRVIVDATNRDNFSRSPYLSDALIRSIQQSMQRGEQSMLYLNKRGTARTILCDQCGWQALCPHCDLPLTYHADTHNVLCHSCTYRGSAPTICPECGNPSIVYRSAGTKLIVEEAARLFPEARIQRFDTDNRKAERLEQHYDALKNGDVDILVGTQLLAKGLDLPHLSTLGVVAADSSLAMPDYTSQERTFQLLNQVLGRVGRGHRGSTAIVQTFNPEARAISAAMTDDWERFYRAELAERQAFTFPPFCFLLKLTCRRASSKSAEKAASDLKQKITARRLPLIVEGPAPSFHEKNAGKFEWQLIVKSKQRDVLLQVIHELPSSGWSYDIDPINLL